ncbi:MAG: hypothetical protein GXY29_01040 [Thermotogaceae bacterium]|nr:hypothetical protein [Thermotogaceae bacterium]
MGYYSHYEKLAYWYFRLNGVLTIQNFVVHPDRGSNQETDVDILGIRLPYRAENLLEPMVDDPIFTTVKEKLYIVIAEIKEGPCSLNGPWTKPERKNMLRVLRAIGAFEEKESNEAEEAIYREGFYENEQYRVSLFCVGEKENEEVKQKYKEVPQITWDNIFEFIYNRFKKYKQTKGSHGQWVYGDRLWNMVRHSQNPGEFKEEFLKSKSTRDKGGDQHTRNNAQ